MSQLSLGELFAGIGGFSAGFERHGWRTGFQVEWDSRCQEILGRHFPTVPKFSDVQEVSGAELPPVDVISFGSPCQDLSVAGRRAGLAGERSGLFYEAVRVIREMRDATQNQFPRGAVWENVPGALSSNGGRDFGAVLWELAELGSYHLEWHILDARYFGVPQRRRRVFVVALFDPGAAIRCSGQVLPVAESLPGHYPASAQAAEDIAGTLGGGTPGGGPTNDTDRMTFVATVTSKWAKGAGGPSGDECQNLVPVADELAFDPELVGPLTTRGTHPRGTETIESHHVLALKSARVRRLTPLECERLQGFPDGWTALRPDGSPMADSHRYRQLGNAVAVPVVAWIGRHLRNVLE